MLVAGKVGLRRDQPGYFYGDVDDQGRQRP
jgi:hypothetical protein